MSMFTSCGTPMMVQIMIALFLCISMLRDYSSGNSCELIFLFDSGILIISMNSGAYVSETVRGDQQCGPKGQLEAAYSLGIRPKMLCVKVILPQASRIFFQLGNEFITIIKDSSLLSGN